VHAIRVANDGTVYVADREFRRVQMFSNDGKFIKQLVKPDTLFARNLRAVVRIPSSSSSMSATQDHRGGRPQDAHTRRRGRCPGMVGGGHQIATDSKGNIYVAATTNGNARSSASRA